MHDFSCERNQDLQNFLHHQAIHFEKADLTRTYIIIDAENSTIYAYFSLSTKEIIVDSSCISKSTRKKLHLDNNDRLRTFLIGQIGKNSDVENNPLDLNDILNEIYPLLLKVQEIIGSRAIILECENNPNLVDYYKQHDFKDINIQTDSNDNELITMYRIIKS